MSVNPFTECLNCGRTLPANGVVCPNCMAPRPFGRLIQNIKVLGGAVALIGGLGYGFVEGLFGPKASVDAPVKVDERRETVAPHPQTIPFNQTPSNRPAGSLPAPGKANISSSPHFANPQEAQREAVRRYPELGVAGSKLNVAFLSRYKLYQRERPNYFADNSWPVRLAEELVTGVGSR